MTCVTKFPLCATQLWCHDSFQIQWHHCRLNCVELCGPGLMGGGGGVPKVGYPPRLGLTGGGVYLRRGTPLGQVWWGVPEDGYPTSRDGITPPPPLQDNRWSTWYAALSMPLAFTQEDFLVLTILHTATNTAKKRIKQNPPFSRSH